MCIMFLLISQKVEKKIKMTTTYTLKIVLRNAIMAIFPERELPKLKIFYLRDIHGMLLSIVLKTVIFSTK